jgi:8-oxo-dGTP pyrophosphatase MutT (NUDIX family)
MATRTDSVRQAGVLPIRDGQICLVTSRSGKRWVVPKGNVSPGKTAGETALLEAWEEAGLVGVLEPEPLGSYLYEKDARLFHVIIFVLKVTDLTDDFPERGSRERVWVQPPQALLQVEDHGLRELIRGHASARAG